MFGAQIIWNAIPFGCIRALNSFLPVETFEISAGVKLERDEETGLTKVTGRTPQTCRFSVRAHSRTETDPRTVFELLNAMRGMSGGIYVANGAAATLSSNLLSRIQTSDWKSLLTAGGAADMAKQMLIGSDMGGVPFLLTEVTQDAELDAHGNIYSSLIALNLIEDSNESQTGGLRVWINDKDVTDSLALESGTYEMHADGEADKLDLLFADTKNRWNKWKPGEKKTDTIKVTDGPVNTGKLYIDTLKPENGKYRVTAYSTPKKMFDVKSRSFTALSLPQLAVKIAKAHGLKVKTYDVPETAAAYTRQRSESDLAFLARTAAASGCAYLLFDGTLCLYLQKAIENGDPTRTITLSRTDTFTVTDDKKEAVARVELRNGKLTGVAEDASVESGKIHRETVTAAWADTAAANAAAAARLRSLNRSTRRAVLDMRMQRRLAAGSVINLLCSGWTGKAFVYRIRHDFAAKKSKIWVRRPLDY